MEDEDDEAEAKRRQGKWKFNISTMKYEWPDMVKEILESIPPPPNDGAFKWVEPNTQVLLTIQSHYYNQMVDIEQYNL